MSQVDRPVAFLRRHWEIGYLVALTTMLWAAAWVLQFDQHLGGYLGWTLAVWAGPISMAAAWLPLTLAVQMVLVGYVFLLFCVGSGGIALGVEGALATGSFWAIAVAASSRCFGLRLVKPAVHMPNDQQRTARWRMRISISGLLAITFFAAASIGLLTWIHNRIPDHWLLGSFSRDFSFTLTWRIGLFLGSAILCTAAWALADFSWKVRWLMAVATILGLPLLWVYIFDLEIAKYGHLVVQVAMPAALVFVALIPFRLAGYRLLLVSVDLEPPATMAVFAGGARRL